MSDALFLLIVMLVLVFMNIPVTYALAISSLVFYITKGLDFMQFIVKLTATLDNFAFLAAPLFIFCGNLMNKGGVTDRIFNFADSLVGHIRGGLGHVNILASAMFAGMSGSAIADAAGLGPIEIKAMQDHGYDLDFSVAVTGASAVIGPIIPPSNIMILYGVTAEVSISRLFLGGAMPGILIAAAEMMMVYYYALKRGYPRNHSFSIKRVWHEFKKSFFSLLTVAVILVGILTGFFTATEAGSVASLYVIIISLFLYREMNLKDVWNSTKEAAAASGVILLLCATAGVFGWCLSFVKAPQMIAKAIVAFTQNKIVILLLFTVVYFILGMLMEASAVVLCTVPIVVPLFRIIGIDLIYFGVLVGILMSIGTLTPPVGTCMFILCKMTGMPIQRWTKVLAPWLIMLMLIIVLLIFFPGIVTWLPSVVY